MENWDGRFAVEIRPLGISHPLRAAFVWSNKGRKINMQYVTFSSHERSGDVLAEQDLPPSIQARFGHLPELGQKCSDEIILE